jgi:hypothetical protein
MKTIPIAITSYNIDIFENKKRVLLFENELDDFISFFKDYAEDINRDVEILKKEMECLVDIPYGKEKAFIFIIFKIEQTVYNPSSEIPEKILKYKLDKDFIHPEIFRNDKTKIIAEYKDKIMPLPELIKSTYESDGSIYPTPPTPQILIERIHQHLLNQDLNQILQKYNLSDF